MNAYVFLRSCLAVVGVVTTLTVTTVDAQTSPEVAKINFTGNKKLSASLLRQAIELSRTSGFQRLAVGSETHTYDEDLVAADIVALTRFYQREGFLSVSVGAPKLDYSKNKRKVTLTFPIVEGLPVLVDRIAYVWLPPLDTARDLIAYLEGRYLDKSQLVSQERFRDSSIILDEQLLVQLMANNGYPFARVTSRLDVNGERTGVVVTWSIDPGVKAHFGSVSVRGAVAVKEQAIARQVAFESSDLYNSDLLRKSQKRVYTLGMFSVVTVRPILDFPADSVIDVEVFVREAPKLSAKLGVGYGTEEKFRTFLDTKYLGFFGDSRRVNLLARHSAIEPYNVTITVTQPAFPDNLSTTSLSPFIRRQDEPGFRATRYGGNLIVGRPIGDHFSGSAMYTYESVKLDISSLADVVQADLPKDLYQKSTVVLSGNFDDSEPLFSPAKGSFIASALTVSGLGFGSEYHFYRILTDLRRYQPVWNSVLAARVKIGGIHTTGVDQFVPVEERLFSGGGTSVRGWGRHKLGPQSGGTPIGGYSLLEGSLELRIPVYKALSIVPFMDAGNVWITPFHYAVDDLRYAAGIGARYSTPIGPIRVDVARPVFDEESTVQLHLSIGQAF